MRAALRPPHGAGAFDGRAVTLGIQRETTQDRTVGHVLDSY